MTSPRLRAVVTELVPIRRSVAGSSRRSKQLGVEKNTHFPVITNFSVVVLQSGGDGFIENLRPKIDENVVVEVLRLVSTVHADRKLQGSFRRLPCFHICCGLGVVHVSSRLF